MSLLWIYLARETPRCIANGIRLEVIGRRDRLEESLRHAIQRTESATAHGRRLHLRMAIDYSAREAILAAAQETTPLSRESLSGALGPPVDLMIRTGGEQRLSDFLLWECAYAEFVFSRRMWPEYGADDLAWAVREFHGRQRRFGAVPVPIEKRGEAWLE
jgi:undecaprenyl diphosphate synthase